MNPIIAPTLTLAAVVLLTITVGIRMFIVRTRVMRERRIHPQAAANSRQAVE